MTGSEQEMLRHFLAALAYRTPKALREAPSDFGDFEAGNLTRAPRELVLHMTPERLLQGPLSDAMTHAGKLAMLRRLHGFPVPPENFIVAEVDRANVGEGQASARSPDREWPEELR